MTPEQQDCLAWLRERGGRAFVDSYGRVIAQGEARPRNSWVAWLNLLAQGYLQGDNGIITIRERSAE